MDTDAEVQMYLDELEALVDLECMIYALDQQAAPSVVGSEPVPPSTNSEIDNNTTGDGKRQSMPFAVMEKIRSLGLAEGESEVLTECFEEVNCIQEIRALANSSEEAVKVLRKGVCTDAALAHQVAKVHVDLHTLLTACVEKGVGKGLLELFFGTCKGAALVDMDAMYQDSRALLVVFVKNSMEAVHGAAKAALQNLERDVTTPPAI